MWFKQIQLFQLNTLLTAPENLIKKLEDLAFQSCMPSMPTSIGWTSPIDEEGAPLIQVMNGYIMLCMQIEEKILPSVVIQQELANKVKAIQKAEDRKIRSKEKLNLKDEITLTLLPRAFSKLSRVYAYIDPNNKWLVLNTTNAKRVEQFISLFKKSVTEDIESIELKKLSPIITHWLKNQSYPNTFSIEKSCVLQDPEDQKRVIRCQQQDLFAASIQSLIKDGCEVKQVAMSWQDRVNFVLIAENFSLTGLQYQEEIVAQVKEMEAETALQVFTADFFIMTQTLTTLLRELQEAFVHVRAKEKLVEEAEVA